MICLRVTLPTLVLFGSLDLAAKLAASPAKSVS